ncbi:MAG: histidine phosphatase family protein [Acetobacteraceae bacterium]|nr:histidine phosphatase family protein [Acetobacteraceae bacterium]MBV9117117.1 histidine phosphatase family protein [Acetobacteraceae bacterium]MBV9776297.1 histidine phosphatase family protein [Acetobacteraceae bacterium]
MHQLLLLRHAKAVAAEGKAADRDRPLSPVGRQAMVAMRAAMRDLGLAPDLILVSTARRTLETLEALEPWDDTPLVDTLDQLYLATPAQMLAELHRVAETVRGVMVIGHNPGLQELAVSLAGGPGGDTEAARRAAEGFPTAALAEFSVAGTWGQLDRRAARLVRLIRPRDLARADR